LARMEKGIAGGKQKTGGLGGEIGGGGGGGDNGIRSKGVPTKGLLPHKHFPLTELTQRDKFMQSRVGRPEISLGIRGEGKLEQK